MQTKSVKGNKAKLAPTQAFLPISEIKDSVVVLKNGGLRAVLQVSPVNFNLKSEDEQNAIITWYQSFLNTLDFPIQIVIRSKKLDIDYYIDSFKEIEKKQKNSLLKNLTGEYIEYIKKLVQYADIMEKQFFIVIPYDPIRSSNRGMFSIFTESVKPNDDVSNIKQRHYEFSRLQKGLLSRVDIVKTAIDTCGVKTDQLKTPKLVELFYQVFNPIVSMNQKGDHFEEETIVDM